MKKIKEFEIQSALVEYAYCLSVGNCLIYIPNEQIIFSKSVRLIQSHKMGWWNKLKKMGFKKGIADLFLALPKGDYHGLFLEIKRKGNYLNSEQKLFLKQSSKNNYACDVAYTVEEGMKIFDHYLGLKEGQIFRSLAL